MRVNSPGLEEGAGGGGGAGADGAAAAVCGAGGAGGGAFGCPKSEASKSSSSARAGGEAAVPKMPVALEGAAPAESFEPGEPGLSKGGLNASIHRHHASENLPYPDSKTTTALLDSKGQSAYDAKTIGGSEVRS